MKAVTIQQVMKIHTFKEGLLLYLQNPAVPKFVLTVCNVSLFHRAFRFTKFYLHQRMHLFLSYTKIT